eukprot:SAG31_NODE_1638_length_7672_cov_4.225142_9_plen_80_part_00
MPSSDEPAARSSTAIIRRIPRSVTREQLDAAIRARGQEPLKLLRLHAQRQCIVEFDGKGCYFLVFVPTIREIRDFYREM